MVAKISVGSSLYGALAYNGEKINEAKGQLLTTNRIYNDGTGKVDIHRAMEYFLGMMPMRSKVEKPVVHISLNPHPGASGYRMGVSGEDGLRQPAVSRFQA